MKQPELPKEHAAAVKSFDEHVRRAAVAAKQRMRDEARLRNWLAALREPRR